MIELQPFTVEDFPRLIGWIDSPELLVQWAGPVLFSFPLDEGQLRAYLATSQGVAPRAMIYKATTQTGEVAGHIELGAIDQQNGSASICRVFVAPQMRGLGICRQMVEQILEIAFARLGLRRVDLRVYGFNTSAIHCYEQSGFEREGLLRQAQRVGEQVWDLVVMGVLREKWEMNHTT